MEHVGGILEAKTHSDNNVNNKLYKYNIVNNVNSSNSNKHALDRRKFTPNTPETQLAERIAASFDDLKNYAFYLKVVNSLGYSNAEPFWKAHMEEEEEKRGTRYAFRNSKKYFTWKYKNKCY